MTYMVVDINNYDVLFGLNFLIKIGAIVDVERGLIQVRHGPWANVEVLPLIMVNILQRINPKTLMQEVATILENTHISDDFGIIDWILDQDSPIMTKGKMHLLQIQILVLIVMNIMMDNLVNLNRLMM